MGKFPQELLDMVIDELADRGYTDMSGYSTISRQWVARTQMHHFKRVYFDDARGLQKWRTAIEPDPSGVSRHVRELVFTGVDTLEGFGEHIRAFTNAEKALIVEGNILLSPSAVESLASLGSSLVGLEICGVPTTPHALASLLAALPRLRKLGAHSLDIEDDHNTIGLPPRIPFFEGANTLHLSLLDDDGILGSLGWVPPSARFRELKIDPACLLDGSERVQQWIASSGGSLEVLSIEGGYLSGIYPPLLDLTGCTALETLRLDILLCGCERFDGGIIPSLSFFRIPKIVLCPVALTTGGADLGNLEVTVGHLYRLAKQFKTTHPGSKMEVELSVSGWSDDEMAMFADRIDSWEPKLREEANVVVRNKKF